MRNRKLVHKFRDTNGLPPDLRPFRPKNYHNGNLSDFSQEYDYEHSGIEMAIPEDLPIDLHKHKIQNKSSIQRAQQGMSRDDLFAQITNDVSILASSITLSTGFISRQVTCGLTSVLLIRAQFLRGYRLANLSTVDTDIILIGNSGVTVSSGHPIFARSFINIYLEDNVELYGISSTGSDLTLSILEL